MKKITYIICIIVLTMIFCSCNSDKVKKNVVDDAPKEKDITLDIITTNKFIYNITKDIVNDKHVVEYMFKENSNYGDYSYTEDSLENISKQDLFIYSGVSLEPWIDEFTSKLKKSKVGIVNLSRGVEIIPYETKEKYGNKEISDNPYYWLNIDNYKIMLLNVKNAIENKDPKNRDVYEKNFYDCVKKLDKLQTQLNSLKDELKKYVFIVSEDKLDYFITYCDLNVVKLKVGNNNKDQKDNVENDVNSNVENIIRQNSDKRVVFLYSDDGAKQYENVLKNHGINLVKIMINDYKQSYKDFMGKNIESLKSLIDK